MSFLHYFAAGFWMGAAALLIFIAAFGTGHTDPMRCACLIAGALLVVSSKLCEIIAEIMELRKATKP